MQQCTSSKTGREISNNKQTIFHRVLSSASSAYHHVLSFCEVQPWTKLKWIQLQITWKAVLYGSTHWQPFIVLVVCHMVDVLACYQSLLQRSKYCITLYICYRSFPS